MDTDSYLQPIRGFRILERLGSGAMGSVYRSRQSSLDRIVALKVVRRESVSRSSMDRFRKEARLLARLNHPNIVRVFEMGEDGGYLYLAMELVEGRSLKDLLAERERLSEGAVLTIAEKVALALGHASAGGIVHRDVKPGNVLIGRNGEVKLSDFGLATAGVDHSLTKTGQTVGTPQYMSPEQARSSRKVDIRSDLFSLGGTLYHALTGRPPFPGESVAEVITSLLFTTPEPPEELVDNLHPGTSRILAKLLAKNPARRYANAEELLEDLGRLRRVLGTDRRSAEDVGLRWSESGLSARAWYRRPETLALALLLVLGMTTIGLLLSRDQGGADPGPDPNKVPTITAASLSEGLKSKTLSPKEVYKHTVELEAQGAIEITDASRLKAQSEDAYEAWLVAQTDGFEERTRQSVRKGQLKQARSKLERMFVGIQDVEEDAPVEFARLFEFYRDRTLDRFDELESRCHLALDEEVENILLALETDLEISIGEGRIREARRKLEDFKLREVRIRIDHEGQDERIPVHVGHQLRDDKAEDVRDRVSRRLSRLTDMIDDEVRTRISEVIAGAGSGVDALEARVLSQGKGKADLERELERMIQEAFEEIGREPREVGDVDDTLADWRGDALDRLKEASRTYESESLARREGEVRTRIEESVVERDYTAAERAMRSGVAVSDSFRGLWERRLQRLKTLRRRLLTALRDLEGQNVSLLNTDRVQLRDRLDRVSVESGLLIFASIPQAPVESLAATEIAERLEGVAEVDRLAIAELLFYDRAFEEAQALLTLTKQSPDQEVLAEALKIELASRQKQVDEAKERILTLKASADQKAAEQNYVDAIAEYQALEADPWLKDRRLLERLPKECRLRTYAVEQREKIESLLEDVRQREAIQKLFHGSVIVDQDGRATLNYAFESAKELEDFDFGSMTYTIGEGGLQSPPPRDDINLYRLSRGPTLDVEFDADKPIEVALTYHAPWEHGTPEFFGLRVGSICFGVKSFVQDKGQVNYWFGILDSWKDHFFDPVLSTKPKSKHPISFRPSLNKGQQYEIRFRYDPEREEVLFLIDGEVAYRLTKGFLKELRSAKGPKGVEFRTSQPGTFPHLEVRGTFDPAWLRKKRS